MFTIYLISTHLAPQTLNENTSNFRLLIAVADLMANGGWMDVATNSRLGYDHDMTFKVEHLKWNPLAHFHCIGLSWLPCSTSMWWWWSVPLLQLLLASGHNHSCRQIQANVAHVAGDGEGVYSTHSTVGLNMTVWETWQVQHTISWLMFTLHSINIYLTKCFYIKIFDTLSQSRQVIMFCIVMFLSKW